MNKSTIMTEYGEAYLDNGGYLIHSETNKPLHIICWLIETNNIREDLGLNHLIKVPKGFQIHHKDKRRINYHYDNLQCVRWDKHCKHHQNKIRR